MGYNHKISFSFSVAFVLGFFLPHTNIVFQLLHSILPLILFIICFIEKQVVLKPSISVIFLISIFVCSFLLNSITLSVESKTFYRLINLILLFFLFPFVSNVKIPNLLLYCSLLFIFFSQIAYVYNISHLINFFDTYFPYEGDRVGFSSEYLLRDAGELDSIIKKRYGGLYHNPNQAVRYVSVILSVFLIENKKKNIVKLLPFIIIAFISFLFSGSRSGFLVGLILLVGFSLYLKEKKIANIVPLFTIIISAFFVLKMIFKSENIRIFNISEGVEHSLGAKLNWFLDFVYQLDSSLHFLLGHCSFDSLTLLYGVQLLDSEWGMLFYSYGLLGFMAFTTFFIFVFSRRYKEVNYYLLLLFWMISSTVIFSFRMSFVFMLCLSKYYSDYIYNKKQNENNYD